MSSVNPNLQQPVQQTPFVKQLAASGLYPSLQTHHISTKLTCDR